MLISLIKTVTLKNYYYYSAVFIVLTIADIVNTSFTTSSISLITASARRTSDINSTTFSSFNKNSNISSNFNK